MDKTAIFKVTYGLYVLTTKTADNKINGCIINTAQQVTAIPERISITVAKSNLTHDLIDESKQFCVSVLGEKADLDMVNIFGMQTGREVNKFEHISYKVDQLGNPYIEEGMIAYLTGKVINQIDLGTHTMFIADYVDGKTLGEDKALTYADYREKRNANKPKENQSQRASYECTVCHYEYDGSFEIPFEELPDDYVCPICRQPKSVFMKKETEAATYECTVCHYEYDASFEVPFENLPDDYVCPICKQPKSVFIKK